MSFAVRPTSVGGPSHTAAIVVTSRANGRARVESFGPELMGCS